MKQKIMLICLFIVALLTCCKFIDDNEIEMDVEIFEVDYHEHSYLLFDGYGVIHDPNCKCHYYRIDNIHCIFRSLKDAKTYVCKMCKQEDRVRLLKDSYIRRIINDKEVSLTPIIVSDKTFRFKKTIKL